MTGYNLPPGVEAYMIPGNRPEDDFVEKFIDDFCSNCTCDSDICEPDSCAENPLEKAIKAWEENDV